jgi:hypothetical protein
MYNFIGYFRRGRSGTATETVFKMTKSAAELACTDIVLSRLGHNNCVDEGCYDKVISSS